MAGRISYTFKAKVWQFQGASGWHFVSLPKRFSREIRKVLQMEEEGWGRLRSTARINQTEWQTAVWFDTRLGTYLLPVRAEVRKSEGIRAGALINVTLII